MPTKEEVFEALKYHVEVDGFGTRRYYNSAGQLHREDGPANAPKWHVSLAPQRTTAPCRWPCNSAH